MKNKMKQILRLEKDPTFRFEILEKFYKQVENEDDIMLIIEMLKNDPDPCVRHEAAAQLFRIEENKSELFVSLKDTAIQVLFDKAQNDTSVVVRHESIEALGYLVGINQLKQLEAFTFSEDLDIKSTAVIAYSAARNRIENNINAKDLGHFLIASWRVD